MQASLPLRFPALFLRVSRARWLRHRPAVCTCPRRNAVSLRRNERERNEDNALRRRRYSTPRRSAKPARFCRSKNGAAKRIPHPSGSPQSCALRVCFSKLKKGLGSRGRACSHTGFQAPFSYRLPRQSRSQLPTQTQVFCFSFDAKEKRLPLVTSRTQPQSQPDRPWAIPPPARRSARDRAAGSAWRKSRSQRQNRPCP